MPLERIITNFVDEIPRQNKGDVCVQYNIGSNSLFFYQPVDMYMPYVEKWDLELIFRALSVEQIVDLFLNIMLENKIVFVSQYWSLLYSFAVGLTNLIFPFVWMHVFVPLIPKSMITALEAPFPFIIGMEKQFLNTEEIPEDVIIVYIDEGIVWNNHELPKLPRDYKILVSRLKKATAFFNKSDEIWEQVISNSDDAFNLYFI